MLGEPKSITERRDMLNGIIKIMNKCLTIL